MATDFTLPDLGEDIAEAEVIGILVGVGDSIAADQPVIEVETEKANLEVPAPHDGVVEAIHVRVGDVIQVGQPLVAIAAAAAAPARDRGGRGALGAGPARRPGGLRGNGYARRGAGAGPARARRGRGSARSGRAGPATAAGRQRRAGRGPRIAGRAAVRGARSACASRTSPAADPAAASRSTTSRRTRRRSRAAAAAAAGPAPAALPDLSQYGAIERERMSATRRATARNLAESWAQSPHITLTQKADVTALDALRRKHPRTASRPPGGSLTKLPILMKVVARALAEFPRLNALDRHRQPGDPSTGATSTSAWRPTASAASSSRSCATSTARASPSSRSRSPSSPPRRATASSASRSCAAGTFTISNLGSLGTGFFTAILHPPQVGILAVGRAEQEPVWIGRRLPAAAAHAARPDRRPPAGRRRRPARAR